MAYPSFYSCYWLPPWRTSLYFEKSNMVNLPPPSLPVSLSFCWVPFPSVYKFLESLQGRQCHFSAYFVRFFAGLVRMFLTAEGIKSWRLNRVSCVVQISNPTYNHTLAYMFIKLLFVIFFFFHLPFSYGIWLFSILSEAQYGHVNFQGLEMESLKRKSVLLDCEIVRGQ